MGNNTMSPTFNFLNSFATLFSAHVISPISIVGNLDLKNATIAVLILVAVFSILLFVGVRNGGRLCSDDLPIVERRRSTG